MMKVLLNSPGYIYDVHSLLKAFYPEEDIIIEEYNKSADNDGGLVIFISSGDIGKEDIATGQIDCKYDYCGITDSESVEYTNADRAHIKNELKLCLYRMMCRVLGTTLPWGTLTGIRPTKIPMKMIRENKSDSQIYDYMKNQYFCSDEKIKLSTGIAHLELGLIDKATDSDSYSLYIGIPFCPTTCLYCSFTSYPIVSWAKRTDEYLDALMKELDYVARTNTGKRLDSVYIGGGTPTTLEPSQLERLIQFVKSHFDFQNVREFTVEAGRPDSITEEKLRVLYDNGVNRLSINPQTMNEKTLKVIGRQHSVEQVVTAFALARKIGFDNINMDLILGLPGEDIADVSYTLDRVRELSPDSITVHSMAIKRAAGMHKFLEEHSEYKSVNTPEMMEIAAVAADKMGMKPYYLYRQKNMAGNFENVGYAREGKYGIYNVLIMEEVQTIIACGAGTVTKRVYPGNINQADGVSDSNSRIERCDNVKDVKLYIEKIDEMIERKRQLFKD